MIAPADMDAYRMFIQPQGLDSFCNSPFDSFHRVQRAQHIRLVVKQTIMNQLNGGGLPERFRQILCGEAPVDFLFIDAPAECQALPQVG